MRIARFLFLLLWTAAPASTQTRFGGPSIFTHNVLTCMSTDDFSTVEAKLDPTELSALRQAQVYFKAGQTEAWYFVNMEPGEGATLQATLPKPLAETDRVDYYLFFLSSSFEPAQSQPYSVRVSETGCEGLRRAAPTSSVSIVLRATVANQPPVPLGFNAQGISSFVTVAGNTVSVGSAVAAGGGAASGGLSGAAIGAIAGGGAAAAAGAVLVAGGNGTDASNGSSSTTSATSPGGTTPTSSASSPSPTPTNSPSPSPSPAPSIPDISGTWNINDRITETCFPESLGQTSSNTMIIQQNGSQLTASINDVDFIGNLMGTIDAAGVIKMSGDFNDEGSIGHVDIEATTKTGSDMTGGYTQFYPDHNCTVRGSFTGSKR